MKKFGILSFLILLLVVSCESNNTKKTEYHEEELGSTDTLVSDSVFVRLVDLKHPSNTTVENLMSSGIPFPDFTEFISYDPENNPATYFFEIDFNDDGLMDVIYQGPSSGESDFVIFCLNKNGEYLSFYEEYTSLERIVFVDSILNTIYINQPGCCADHSFLQKQNHFVYHNDKFHSERLKTICSYGEPDFKNKFREPKRIEISSSPYYLRFEPRIDNDTVFYGNDDKSDWLIIGNKIGTLKKGDRATAMAYEKDDSGREWWFVVLDATVRPEENYFDYVIQPENKNLQFSGWVSSRYVKVLGE